MPNNFWPVGAAIGDVDQSGRILRKSASILRIDVDTRAKALFGSFGALIVDSNRPAEFSVNRLQFSVLIAISSILYTFFPCCENIAENIKYRYFISANGRQPAWRNGHR